MPYLRTIEIDKLPKKYKSRIRKVTKLKYLTYMAGRGGKTLEEAIKVLEDNYQEDQK
jgi:hypothetical protein